MPSGSWRSRESERMNVTKKDLANAIAVETGLTQAQAAAVTQCVFDGILQTLLNHGRLELRNFGVFEVKKRSPRRARNPRTGELVEVAAKRAVAFKPGRRMKALVGILSSPDDKP